MRRLLYLALGWAALSAAPVPAAAGAAVRDTLLQETLMLLHDGLDGPDPVRALPLLEAVSRRTGRPLGQVRSHLRQRLDQLDRLSRTDTAAWRAVIDLRGPHLSPRRTRRLLRELVDLTARVLDDEGDYLLGASIRHAAAQAHVPAAAAAAYTRRLVVLGIVDTTTAWVPAPVSLVVSGWTEAYEFSLTPLFAFFDTDDEAHVRESVRDVQRFVVPRLVRRLPASRAVRYALRDRDLTALVTPDYEVRVTVLSLRFTGTNADLRPCMDARLDLRDRETQAVAWTTTLSHCTTEHGSTSTHELDAFYDEIADALYARLDEYLETPR